MPRANANGVVSNPLILSLTITLHMPKNYNISYKSAIDYTMHARLQWTATLLKEYVERSGWH